MCKNHQVSVSQGKDVEFKEAKDLAMRASPYTRPNKLKIFLASTSLGGLSLYLVPVALSMVRLHLTLKYP